MKRAGPGDTASDSFAFALLGVSGVSNYILKMYTNLIKIVSALTSV